MNLFDKICAVLAFMVGVAFIVLGVIGIFTGCRANFTLPPLLGVLPALAGWGMVRPIILAWKMPPARGENFRSDPGYTPTTGVGSFDARPPQNRQHGNPETNSRM